MLMNGKEVNHLVINGEAFDKSNCEHKIRFLKEFASRDGHVSPEGVSMGSGQGGAAIMKGSIGHIFLKYKNGYCVYMDIDPLKNGFWVTEDLIEFIDDKTGGG